MHGFAARHREPRFFGVGHGHARELPHRRPAQLAALERRTDGGQVFQRFRHAQLLLRGARAVSEEAFDVLGERGVAKVDVDGGPQRREQAAAFFGVQSPARSRESRQRFVHPSPRARLTSCAGRSVIRFAADRSGHTRRFMTNTMVPQTRYQHDSFITR